MLTFNEINSILESPFMSGGICTPKDQLTRQDLYQACHHELVASALATKIAHKAVLAGAGTAFDMQQSGISFSSSLCYTESPITEE